LTNGEYLNTISHRKLSNGKRRISKKIIDGKLFQEVTEIIHKKTKQKSVGVRTILVEVDKNFIKQISVKCTR